MTQIKLIFVDKILLNRSSLSPLRSVFLFGGKYKPVQFEETPFLF